MGAQSSGGQGEPLAYSRTERIAQLRAFAASCAEAACLFSEHGPADLGTAYASLAEVAHRLLSSPFEHSDLRELGAAVPARPTWLHPKYLDYNGPREPWQETAARHVQDAERAALGLRSVAYYSG